MPSKPKPKKPDPVTVHIRWMIRRDMEEVQAIENTQKHPWSEDDFLNALRKRNCIGMVAEAEGKVLGFMVYELHKYKLHLLNMAVDLSFRRRTIGKQIVLKLAAKLSSHRRTRITVDVDETNLAGLLFLKSQGFVAIVLNYVDGLDTIRMQFGENADDDRFERVNRVARFLEET